MPNIKSAKKRVKVIATKTALNKSRKSNLKTVLKNADLACANKADNSEEAIRLAMHKLPIKCKFIKKEEDGEQ